MKYSAGLAVCAALLTSACAEIGTNSATSQGQVENVPDSVLAIAAPYQNLNDIRIDPVDGCYTWRHDGPVESTYLPLRTNEGNPICSVAAEA